MKKSAGFMPKFLGMVFVLFIGILVFAYIETKRANPVMLDEQGHVRGGAAQGSH